MMKQYLLAGTLMLGGLWSPQAGAKDLCSYDFEVQKDFAGDFNMLDANNDGYKWAWYKYSSGNSPRSYARVYSYSAKSYNDYLTTSNPVALQPGRIYKLCYEAWSESYDTKAKINFGYGTSATPTDATYLGAKEVKYINKYTGEQADVIEQAFEVTSAGNYYLSFHVDGTAGVGLDNIKLIDVGTPSTPAPATELKVTPDPDFGLSATVSCKLPSLTMTGAPLSSLSKVEISRDDTVAYTATEGLVPGESFTWTDAEAPQGNVTYTVTVYNGDDNSDPVSASAWVGPLTPRPVTALTLNAKGNVYTLTWTAPAKSINDVDLSPELLKYDVYRIVGTDTTRVALNLDEATYADTFTPEGRVSLAYKVVSKYGRGVGEGVCTDAIRAGSINLAFEDSFADRKMNPDWTSEIISGSYEWEVTSTGTNPYCDPQDKDGGMIYFNSYRANKSSNARLYTPDINTSSAKNASISFYVYQEASSKIDAVGIEVSNDGGDWIEVEGSKTVIGGDKAGWKYVKIGLQDLIKDSQTFRVALRSYSNYGNNVFVDNVKVYNAMSHDLKATVSGAEEAVAGKEATYTVTVANQGLAVSAADYSVAVKVNGEKAADLESVDLAADASIDIPFKYTFSAAQAGQTALSVEIAYEADEETTNNTAEASVEVSCSSLPKVSEISYTTEGNDIILSWTNPAPSDGYVATDIAEDFKDAEENDDHVYCGWKSVDLDQAATGTLYGFKSSVWKLFDQKNSYAPQATNGSKWLAVICPSTGVADDWLISPELTPFDAAKVNVTFMVVPMKNSSSGHLTLEVAYSTTGTEPGDFTTAFTKAWTSTINDKIWTPLTVQVPGNAKYVALHNVSEVSGAMIGIDKVTVKSELAQVLGYHVYEDGVRHNTELITETSYRVAAPAEENALGRAADTRNFQVTALYAEGESELSRMVNVTTGIEGVEASQSIRVADGMIITDGAADVFALDGTRVASVRSAASISMAPGIYVVRTADATAKVIVK